MKADLLMYVRVPPGITVNYGWGVWGNAALNTVVMCPDLRKRIAGQGLRAAATLAVRVHLSAEAFFVIISTLGSPWTAADDENTNRLIPEMSGMPGLVARFVGQYPDP